LEVADHAFPPPRTALSHSKMLVRNLMFKFGAFKEYCTFVSRFAEIAELEEPLEG
jgi:hypothetical protein